MATQSDLMGLGVPVYHAERLGVTPRIATAFGTSAGSANPIGPTGYLTFCLTGTSSFLLPPVGGANGCLLGDTFIIANMSGASVQIYAANTPQGSAVTIFFKAASLAGTTGASLQSGFPAIFKPITVSTWVALVGGSA